jgi:hypothetical protein
MFEYRVCACGKQYTIDEYTNEDFIKSGLCDDCHFEKEYGRSIHDVFRKKLAIADWQDKEIAAQWKKHSETNMTILISKCSGCRYKN